MEPVSPRLMLITPPLSLDGGWASRLEAACRDGGVAAVLLRFAAADERSIINIIKDIAPPLQALDVAVIAETDAGIAVRGGADGVHVQGAPDVIRAARKASPRGRNESRSIGAGQLRSRHDAMDAGEADVDYVMFGEPRADGSLPPVSVTVERASWWAEIFQIPCVAYASAPEMVAPLGATGAEFVALGEWALLAENSGDVIQEALAALGENLSMDQSA